METSLRSQFHKVHVASSSRLVPMLMHRSVFVVCGCLLNAAFCAEGELCTSPPVALAVLKADPSGGYEWERSAASHAGSSLPDADLVKTSPASSTEPAPSSCAAWS